MMIRTDLTSQYKTKFCKKYLANGYCPYGQRCLFIHDQKEQQHKQNQSKSAVEKLEIVSKPKEDASESVSGSQPVKSGMVYSELLVHNINVSLQEHQKKLFVYNKKTVKNKEKKVVDQLPSPGLQYMNIYSKQAPRLSCFSSVAKVEAIEEDDPKVYLHGNASAYESYLESIMKKQPFEYLQNLHCFDTFVEKQPISYSYMPEHQVDQYHSYFESQGCDPISNIFYSIKRSELLTAAKSKLKLESSSFTPTFVPSV
jgi:hypothetical protein